MIKIPLTATPNQALNMTLNRQNATIAVYQRAGFCYLDLGVDADMIVRGQLIVPCAAILPPSARFSGQFVMIDTQSPPAEQQDPDYTGFAGQFEMFYCTPEEWAELQPQLTALGA